MRGDGVQVLIVGAGIAGLAVARTLRAWGAAVEMIDQSASPRGGGTGIYLPGNAVRALGHLGLAGPVAERAVRISLQRTSDHGGRRLFETDVDELWDGVGPCLALPRAELHRVLLDAIGDVPIRWGQAPRRISTDERAATVTTDDGRTTSYDLVLGADGVHSAVRALVLGDGAVRPLGRYAHRFLVPAEHPGSTWSARLGRGAAFLTIPVGDDQVYCYCDGPAADPPVRPADLLAGYVEPVPTLIARADPATIQEGRLEEVVLGRWTRGRVLLVGDAAHAASPSMAQGAAMAIEDALVVAQSLATAGSVAEGLAAHERRRRPRTEQVRVQARRRDRARDLPAPLRDMLLARFGNSVVRANYRLLRTPA